MRNLQTSEREKEKENVPHRPYQAVASINHHMFIGLQHIIPIEFKACMFTHRPHPLYITRNVLDSKDHILSYFSLLHILLQNCVLPLKSIYLHQCVGDSPYFFSQSNLELLLNYPM